MNASEPGGPVHAPDRGGARGFRRIWSAEILTPIALVVVVVLAGVAWARSAAERRALDLASFDFAWELLRDRHYDPALGGVDWQAARDELRPRMAATRSRGEAREVLRTLISRLGQSHVAVFPGEALDVGTYAREAGGPGLDLVLVDGHALVRRVDEGGPAAAAGVRPGWELLAVDAEEVATLLAALDAELPPGSSHRLHLADAVARRLRGPIGRTRSLRLLDGEGEPVERTLVLAEPPAHLAQVGNLPAGYVRMEVERLPGDVGYVALDAFIEPAYAMRRFNEAMEAFLGARGLVLDLRGNGGGMSEMVLGMLAWLTPEPVRIGRMVTRDGSTPIVVRPRARSYAGPVAVLIDERCLSGAELFAQGARDLPDVRLFGTATAGGVQGGLIERLPNGDALMYPYSDVRTAAGESLEGVGVAPDVELAPTRAQLLAGEDPVLAAALDWIATRPVPDGPAPRRPRPPLPGQDATAARVPAEIEPRAAEVLDRHVEATGGRAAYEAIASRVVHGRLRLGGSEGLAIEKLRTLYQARPDRALLVDRSDYLGESRVGMAGDVVWESSLFFDTRPLEGVPRELALRTLRLDAAVRWRDDLRRAEYRGLDTVDARAAHHVHLETRAGCSEERWYDLETGRLTRATARPPETLGDVRADLRFSDYRRTGGILLPHRVETTTMGQRSEWIVDRVETDVLLADDLFRLPEAPSAAPPAAFAATADPATGAPH
ncbi:MAG: hypothetical protein KDB94_07615 [Acidobacteria bacterium]|nr:hypothetical protein [Acidobacteriota bacterium]